MDLYLFTSTLVTLFVILDPPGLLPVFLGLTRRMTRKERNASALNASLVGGGVILLFALFGRQLLAYLHVSMPALQLAGGLLLLLVALELLQGKATETTEQGTNVAIVPLGIPLLAGPGSIVAIMLAVDDAGDPARLLAVGLALAAAMLLVYLFLRFAGIIHRVLGTSGTTLASRIAGLLLAGIAVQMSADGVFGLIALS
nr:MarC family protein [Propionibacterium sp.]